MSSILKINLLHHKMPIKILQSSAFSQSANGKKTCICVPLISFRPFRYLKSTNFLFLISNAFCSVFSYMMICVKIQFYYIFVLCGFFLN
jgi:hypothetical protein